MELSFNYDDIVQHIEFDDRNLDKMWLSLSLEPADNLTAEEKAKRLQEVIDEQLNRPDYNSWHKLRRRSVPMSMITEYVDDTDGDDTLAKEARGNIGYYTDDDAHREIEEREEFEEDCHWVREVLSKKPLWAEAFISIRMRSVSVKDFACTIGVSENVVSQWLIRAEKKLRKFYENRQI